MKIGIKPTQSMEKEKHKSSLNMRQDVLPDFLSNNSNNRERLLKQNSNELSFKGRFSNMQKILLTYNNSSYVIYNFNISGYYGVKNY